MATVVNERVALRPTIYKSNGAAINLSQNASAIKRVLAAMFAFGEQGFVYDPNDLTAEKINWRRNLLTETEFRNGLNDAALKAGALSPVAFAGLTQGTGIQLGTAAGGTYIYKSAKYKANTPYTFSCYVRMLDGTAPRFGISGSGSEVDICLVLRGAAYQAEVQDLGGGLYRAYATASGTIVSGNFGVVKFQTNSSKPVIVTGYQLEEASQPSAYQPFTDFNTEFIKQFPLHTLYQDTAGTIPVTTQGQPVGLILDKSKGVVLGAELASVTEVVSLPVDGVGGVKTYPIGTVVIGKTYQISFTVSNFTGSGDVGIAGPTTHWLDGSSVVVLSNDTKRCIRTKLTASEVNLYTRNTAACVFSNISIKELKGNHAYQSVSASRPILQQTPILAANLLPTYDFRTWSATGTPNPLTANSFTTAATGGVQTAILKPNTSYVIELDIENTTTVTIYHGASTSTAVASGTRRKVLFQATTDTGAAFYLRNAAAGTTTVHSISVREITGYRTDQNYLAFDGVDDFLQTNSIDFTATDKVSLFAGVRNYATSIVGVLAELSFSADSATNTGSFYLAVPSTANFRAQARGTLSTASFVSIPVNSAANLPSIFTAKYDLANKVTLRLDSLQTEGVGSNVQGGFNSYPLYIGRRGGTAYPFSGHLYGLIGIGRLTSDSETLALEKAIAKNTGVTL